ncbi:Uncharacterised protein [Providencia rettgeri]|uniref:Uncharacterized protein n=1 Tax=Providencia rettgeri TaxID=587 RepID=A0A379FSP9_PRORE|nr:Uncharacterised protein [Providencia rettgeri]
MLLMLKLIKQIFLVILIELNINSYLIILSDIYIKDTVFNIFDLFHVS